MSAPSPAILQSMQQASRLLQAGHFAEARAVLSAVLTAAPDFVEARRLLGGALRALGEMAAAEQELRRAVAIDPRWAPALAALGELLLETGRVDEAEQTLRQALVCGPKYHRAAVSLARLLLEHGRAEEARQTLLPYAATTDAPAEVLDVYASVLGALGCHDEAARLLARLVAVQPHDGLAEARLAAELAAAHHYAAASASARRALGKGVDRAELWFVVGTAAAGENRYDEAEAAFREACARQPDYVDAQRELAQLVWMRSGDLTAACAELDAALRKHPHAHALLAVKANLLQSAGDDAGALDLLATVADRAAAPAPLLLAASEAALKSGFAERAVGYAERALRIQPDHPAALSMYGFALLGTGRAAEAERVAEHALAALAENQGVLALLATARRLRGDPSYRQIYDYAGLVHTWTIDTPPGWSDLASYLADLAASLHRLHGLTTHPIHQSLRHGTQTTCNLLECEDPPIRAFRHAIDGPIRRHLETIGVGADPTRRRNTGRYRIQGIWSVRLRSGGYHTNHVHPEGWLSSACYIALPEAVTRGRQGWLQFGEPGFPTTPALPPEHFVRPEPGLLALFPSHLWHGTVPFEGTQPRLTIAFDVVPD
jgi:tetratricopeptide (TPR) repeat protein